MPDQLELEPGELLDRMRDGVAEVLSRALNDKALLVDGALPFLGVSTAWPAPVTRDKRTVGYALRHDLWRHGQRLDEMVATHLSLDPQLSNAINDAAAAAVGVADLQKRDPTSRPTLSALIDGAAPRRGRRRLDDRSRGPD